MKDITKFFDMGNMVRNTIGFSQLMEGVHDNIMDNLNTKFPPYNIIAVSDTVSRLELAVAGFSEKDITVSRNNNKLIITGQISTEESKEDEKYHYKGISSKSFTRSFYLTDNTEVMGASLDNGILSIVVECKPFDEKSTIPIVKK